MSVVVTPVAPFKGRVPVTVGAVSSAVVNAMLVGLMATPLASVAVPAMPSV